MLFLAKRMDRISLASKIQFISITAERADYRLIVPCNHGWLYRIVINRTIKIATVTRRNSWRVICEQSAIKCKHQWHGNNSFDIFLLYAVWTFFFHKNRRFPIKTLSFSLSLSLHLHLPLLGKSLLHFLFVALRLSFCVIGKQSKTLFESTIECIYAPSHHP